MTSRRRFLHNITLSAMAIPFVGWRCSDNHPFMNTSKQGGPVLRVALMGLGGYASRVAEAMQACRKAKVTALVSGTPSKLRSWSARYNIPEKNCYSYDSFDEIRNNPDIDAVYVITPNGLHHDHVTRAAKAGKHVICEKPMATSSQQAQEMIDACNKANVRLLIGYRMHFEPKTLEIVGMRREGELGKITFFQGLSGFRVGNPNQWRLNKELSGGGSMMDIGIYSVNGARYMVGEEPIWVTAQETKTDQVKFKEGIDETLQFQFGFASGATASCLSTYNMNNLDRFFLNGQDGYAELFPATGYGPIQGRTNKGELNQPHIAHQTIQMDEMSDIILQGKKPMVPVDGEEGLKDLVLIEKIYEAAATGKKMHLP